jgi:AcrR family transcriptional regulator
MSPRPYRLGQRQASSEQTRARILDAARELLMAPESLSSFSIDAIARRADVARMTVYYQFGSKPGLLEAIFDDLASRGGMDRMAEAFRQPDPLAALATYIAVLGGFYDAHRLIDRRLRGLAVLDSDLGQALRARDQRRRTGLGVLVPRLTERYGRPVPEACDEAVAVLHMLTSFESFDSLAGDTRGPVDVVPLLQRTALAVIGLGSVEPLPPIEPGRGDAALESCPPAGASTTTSDASP